MFVDFTEVDNPSLLLCFEQRATLTFGWTNFTRKIKAAFLPRLLPPLSPSHPCWMLAGHQCAQVSDERGLVGTGVHR